MKTQHTFGFCIPTPCHEKLPKKMKVFLWLIVFAFFIELPNDVFAQNKTQTNSSELSQIRELHGRVTDEKGQPMDFATVQVFDKGVSRGGAKTDINGNYKIKPL